MHRRLVPHPLVPILSFVHSLGRSVICPGPKLFKSRVSAYLRCFDAVFWDYTWPLESALRQSSPCQINVKFAILFGFGLNFSVVTFCENQYFHDNDKQKSSKTVNLKFCAIQISLWKANTNILNCGVWQPKYTRTKKKVFWCQLKDAKQRPIKCHSCSFLSSLSAVDR